MFNRLWPFKIYDVMRNIEVYYVLEGFKGFEGFEGFEGFKGFKGSKGSKNLECYY